MAPKQRLCLLALLTFIGRETIAEELTDPTRPSGFSTHAAETTKPAASALVLTFVRLGEAPLAVINGENVRPGQSIAGYRLLALQANSATLAGSGGQLVLKLSPTLQKSLAMPRP